MRTTLNSKLKKISRANAKSVGNVIDNKLRHLAFDNTAQANIITTVLDGKIVLFNSAASKLLGYSKKELLTKNRSAIFNIKESSFKKMLRQRTVAGNSIATVTVYKKNDKVITCKITSAVFLDEDGNENAITTITDLSESIMLQKNIDTAKEKVVADDIVQARSKQEAIDIIKVKKVTADIDLAILKQQKLDTKNEKVVTGNIVLAQAKSDARLAENNAWIKYIAKASYDVMWDWDIVTGEIYVGDSVKEVFGYSTRNNTMQFSDFCKCLLPGEKYIVENKITETLAAGSKIWDDAFMFKRRDGSVASVTCRASIIRDDAGKAMHVIGAMHDVSRLLELEQKMEAQVVVHQEDSDKFLLAAKLSFDVIWDWNLLTNEVFLGDGFEELFGYQVKNNKGDMITDWFNYLHPDDKDKVVADLLATIKSKATQWEHAYRVSRSDGSVARVYVRASIFRYADGRAYRIIGAMQDLSRQKELEEKLEQEIVMKEKQIADAAADAKETERSDIGKELHDNINQLLAASKMYIEMAKRGGENSAMYLSRSSEYTITAIEEIRKLTKGLTTDLIKNLGLTDAIENVIRDTMEVSPVNISCNIAGFEEDHVDEKFKLNIFRIIQEQLTNILKHAKATKINIGLVQNKESITLVISDNGVGFNTNTKKNGIGIPNIKSRATAYNGTLALVSKPGNGCVLTAVFPATGLLVSC